MLLRKALLLAAFAVAAVLPCWCQQVPATNPSVSGLLVKLHSKNWIERSDAVDEIRSDPDTLRSPKIQTALIDLLDQEERELDQSKAPAENRQGANGGNDQDGIEESGYGEYFSDLADTVGSFADWNDPRQVRLLVAAAAVDYPPSPKEAAARARAAMPFILKRAKDDDPINRAIAIPMLVEALARGKDALDSKTVESAKKIIVDDLHDSHDGVRGATVAALGSFGGADTMPMLQEIAQSDPATAKTDNGGQWFPIRDLAAKSIAEIQNREAQHAK